MLWLIRPIHFLYVISPQAMLMRQQERLEGRVQNIDEQLTKLESDKTLMKVQYNTHRDTILSIGTVLCHRVRFVL